MTSTTAITRLVIDGETVGIASGELIREQRTLAKGQPSHRSWSAHAVMTDPPRNWPPDVTSIELEAGGEVLVGRASIWQKAAASGPRVRVQITIVGDGELVAKASA